MATFVSVKKMLTFPQVKRTRSMNRLLRAIKNRLVTTRFAPSGAATSRLAGQVDVAGLTAYGIPLLKANGRRVNGG